MRHSFKESLVTIKQLGMAIYATYLTNLFGFRLQKAPTTQEKKALRTQYSIELLDKLGITIKVINEDKIPTDGQYLLLSNHKSVIDPLIIEVATQNRSIFGHWISKKELYNSFFFGKFVRNAGTILLDREASQMSAFFAEIKARVKEGDSIYIFPEGTRNTSDAPLGEFKEGAQLIALKNRLPMLPVYIRSDANSTLMAALKDETKERIIEVEFGDIIDYKDRSVPLQERYQQTFKI
jgi:1-acyl-sn-glycerol-3-phosphate acyltransferase